MAAHKDEHCETVGGAGCPLCGLCYTCGCECEEEVEGDDDWSDDDGLSDAEADAMTLASAGWGTDEDYNHWDDGGDF